MIVSLHPCIEIGTQILLHERKLTSKQRELVKKADRVILPQGVTSEIYSFCKKHCTRIFPNYDYRFSFQGKIGDALLWRRFKMPHPETHIYPKAVEFRDTFIKPEFPLPLPYPFVLKANHGGEGTTVFLIRNRENLEKQAKMLEKSDKHSCLPGMVIQEYIPSGGRDLRVIVINNKRIFFWRVQKNPGEWKTNVSRGGIIDFSVSVEIKRSVQKYLDPFLAATGINLAAFDVLFREKSPFFLEINYYFGRSALGGSDRYYKVLEKEVLKWLKDSGSPVEKT